MSRVPREDGGFSGFPHLMERAKPGFIAVRQDGRRFVNEADLPRPHVRPVQRHQWVQRNPNLRLICDHRAHRRCAWLVQTLPVPDCGDYLDVFSIFANGR